MTARVISLAAYRTQLAKAKGGAVCACGSNHVLSVRDAMSVERDADGKPTGVVWALGCWLRKIGAAS